MNILNRQYQRGFSVLEGLVAFIVVTGGLLAVASFQAGLFSSSAYNKTRTEALSLAQQKIEEFRHYPDADADNFIDNNGDGVMDADGAYADAPIVGNNAEFTRAWELSTTDDSKRVNVTVSWVDSANETQSVSLASSISYTSPRAGADQLGQFSEPLVNSPTGRAEQGEGTLDDYPAEELTQISSAGDDGLSTYQYQEDLFLVDPSDNVVLRLRDACISAAGTCTQFVKISGTIYFDNAMFPGSFRPSDVNVLASSTSFCQRWVDSGTIDSPPRTANGDYDYMNYSCYFGGGWFGNIGFVSARGLQLSDKVCQGDPVALENWETPVIALRRNYRGMLAFNSGTGVKYKSHGIRDAAQMSGHDFVVSRLDPDYTLGSYCVAADGPDGPMTRTDSAGGRLFAGTPTDFVCLNEDDDADQQPDYLDGYDARVYSAATYCPFDPSDPPVLSHTVSGTVTVLNSETLDLSTLQLVTSDGPNNCQVTTPFSAVTNGYSAQYSCTVWDWGSGWTGTVQVRPYSTDIYCASDTAAFADMMTDQTADFSCSGTSIINIGGSIKYLSEGVPVTAIAVTNLFSNESGVCAINDTATAYECKLPYTYLSTDFELAFKTLGYVCNSTDGSFSFAGMSKEDSPITFDIGVSSSADACLLMEPAPQ